MGTTVNLNGNNYTVPALGEGGWGTGATSLTNYLIALGSGVLQKAGGAFTLTADINFGASYGIKAVKFSSINTPAAAGAVRLGNNESVSWRDAGNTADKALKVNTSDVLEFDGNPLLTLGLGTADTVLKMNTGATAYEFGKLADANIAAGAAIDAAKIAGGGVSSTVFDYLVGVSSSIQTQLNAKIDDVATANDNEIPRFNTNGQALQNSGVTLDDSDNMAGVNNILLAGLIDMSTSVAMNIGPTNASIINIGQSGMTTLVKGNLQVDGTTTTVNSQILDVADANITINNGGNQASANNTAGITVEMSDATDVILLYSSSLASRWKIGDVGSEQEVLTVGHAQTISAIKTHTANSIYNNQKGIRFLEQTGNGTNYIGLIAPDAVTASIDFKLPDGDGGAAQVLATNGSGSLQWATVAAGIGTNAGVHAVSSANYTILDADGYRTILVTTGASDRTITLPTAADNGTRSITIKKVDSGIGTVIVDGEGAETIDGNATITITDQFGGIEIVCDTSSWTRTSGHADSTNSGLTVMNSSASSNNVGEYEEGTLSTTFDFNGSGTDYGLSASTDIEITRVGRAVTISGLALLHTSSTGSTTFTSSSTLPTWARPSANKFGFVPGRDNGTADTAPALLAVTSAGNIQLARDTQGNVWTTGAASTGFDAAWSMTYVV